MEFRFIILLFFVFRPIKLRTIGPKFCNKSYVFNQDSIDNIKEKLNKYWTDVELPPNYFIEENSSRENKIRSISDRKESIWFHEWEKHGTCAVTLPALNSEFKYFYQGIAWSEKYNMKDILEKSNISVNSVLKVNDYWNAVKKVLNTTSWVECYFKHVSYSILSLNNSKSNHHKYGYFYVIA